MRIQQQCGPKQLRQRLTPDLFKDDLSLGPPVLLAVIYAGPERKSDARQLAQETGKVVASIALEVMALDPARCRAPCQSSCKKSDV